MPTHYRARPPPCHPAGVAAKKQYQAAKTLMQHKLKAAVGARNRAEKEAAAAALDRLFEVAADGSAAAWHAAAEGLSDMERSALAAKGVDLEKYRQGLAARVAGGAGEAGSGGEDGSASDGDSSEEEGEEEEEEEGLSSDEEASGSEGEEEEGSDWSPGSEGEEEGSEWETASESEEEEEEAEPAAGGAGAQPPSFFWERRQQQGQQGFSPLHFEVEAFAQRATPTQAEVRCGRCGWSATVGRRGSRRWAAPARCARCGAGCRLLPTVGARAHLRPAKPPTPALAWCRCAGGRRAECSAGGGCRLPRAVAALTRRALRLAGVGLRPQPASRAVGGPCPQLGRSMQCAAWDLSQPLLLAARPATPAYP